MGKDSRSPSDEEFHRRIVRLAVVLRRMSAKRPDLVPGFLAARRRPILLVLHAFMGLGHAPGNTCKEILEQRLIEAEDFPPETHYALLARLWPAVYAEPPAPAPGAATCFSELLELRSARRRAKRSLYADGDKIEIADKHRLQRAIPMPQALAVVMGRERVTKPSMQSVREPREFRFPEFEGMLLKEG